MRPIRTLVVIASEGEAKFMKNEGVGKGLQEVSGVTIDVLNPEAHEFADDPGRNSAAPGMGRHAFDPETPERDHKRREFASLVAERVKALWDKGDYDRIVLAAPPKMLGELRGRLETLSDKIYAEVDKDLVNTPVRELPDRFADVAAF